MLSEGFKETENTRIEKDEETLDEIEMLYSFGVVLFEHVILESKDKNYSICYFAPQQLYDVVIENRGGGLVSYDTMKTLDSNLSALFNLVKNESIILDDRKFNCTSHSIEHTL